MNALVLCGGQGSRLDADVEKPLYEVAGTPMVDHVVRAVQDAERVAELYAAVSPNTPATVDHLADSGDVAVVETPGEGYVADLGTALEAVGTPAVTVAADLPLLTGEHVDAAIEVGEETTTADSSVASVTVQTPARLKRQLGVSADESDSNDVVRNSNDLEWLPAGLNVVGADEAVTHSSWDARLAVNVNYERDAVVAEALVGEL